MKTWICPIIISFIILLVFIPNAWAEIENTSVVKENTKETSPGTVWNISASGNERDNISISLIKAPKTDLIYASGINSTGAANEKENVSDDNSDDTAGMIGGNSSNLTKYNSLGEIIKAKDWNALSEYKCKMRTENPNSFDNSEITLSDKQARWDTRFTGEPDVVIIPGCCG